MSTYFQERLYADESAQYGTVCGSPQSGRPQTRDTARYQPQSAVSRARTGPSGALMAGRVRRFHRELSQSAGLPGGRPAGRQHGTASRETAARPTNPASSSRGRGEQLRLDKLKALDREKSLNNIHTYIYTYRHDLSRF